MTTYSVRRRAAVCSSWEASMHTPCRTDANSFSQSFALDPQLATWSVVSQLEASRVTSKRVVRSGRVADRR